jgi:hypothetical protein
MTGSRKQGKLDQTGEKASAQIRRDDAWDDRLRRVGDARFVEVAWSTRDKPCWPLPTDAAD